MAALLLAAGCSTGGDTDEGSGSTGGSGKQTTAFEEPTISEESSQDETTTNATVQETTLGAGKEEPDVVLRLEGDPKTRFSGRCTDGKQETVLKGKVPKRYAYDLAGDELQCSIQKRDAGNGSLKVILTAGNTTRSVQQTNTRGGEIKISYSSSG
ncbi:MAG TPA: hypothetical protein VFJ72_15100 [Rubrobacteraceae bacterium]|nr:hypothetical protein [Rubrobacteraceae bacterium]